MFKKNTNLVILLQIVLMTLLNACTENHQNTAYSCKKDKCLTYELHGGVTVIFNTKSRLLVETPTEMQIKSPVAIKSAKFIALNMNMGAIPLNLTRIPNESNYIYKSIVMFGMCSQPQMEWHLQLNTESGIKLIPLITYWK